MKTVVYEKYGPVLATSLIQVINLQFPCPLTQFFQLSFSPINYSQPRAFIMIPDLLPCWIYLLTSINKLIKHWTRPVTFLLGVGAFADFCRSCPDLIIENAFFDSNSSFSTAR
jgi:hypothetical protein